MKEFALKNIRRCPVCNSTVRLRRNASKDFQIACRNKECQYKTGWRRKVDAVIEHYNLCEAIDRQKAKE